MTHEEGTQPIADQTAPLEQAFIDEFIRRRGYDPTRLADVPQSERDELLRQATAYAASRLAEVESRAHYVHEIHGNR